MRNLYVVSVLGQNTNKTICTKPLRLGSQVALSTELQQMNSLLWSIWRTQLGNIGYSRASPVLHL